MSIYNNERDVKRMVARNLIGGICVAIIFFIGWAIDNLFPDLLNMLRIFIDSIS